MHIARDDELVRVTSGDAILGSAFLSDGSDDTPMLINCMSLSRSFKEGEW